MRNRLFDGGVIVVLVVALFGWIMSNIYPSVPPDTECVGLACQAEHGNGPPARAPAAADPAPDPEPDTDDDDSDDDDSDDDDDGKPARVGHNTEKSYV